MAAIGNRKMDGSGKEQKPILPARPVVGPAVGAQPVKPVPDAGLQPVKPDPAQPQGTPAIPPSALRPTYSQTAAGQQGSTPPTFDPVQETQPQTQTTPQQQPQNEPRPGERVYTYEELEEYQQGLTAEDKALWDTGAKFYRNSRYTATPNERTIRLERPIYGDLWYYDPGERIYEGQSAPVQMEETGGTAGAQRPIPGGTAVPAGGSSDLTSLLEAWKKAAAEQSNGQIDYAVSQAITELERALADAQGQFKEQAESVALDERQALDNSALYAEMRGDKGGIGQSQYNEIQAAAAQNRLAVQQAQTKLATDTSRQIADLRAQGEFEKADKLLEITQTYLSQLISLEQWQAEFGLSQQQFQASLQQWQAEYDLAMREFDYNVATNERGYTASMAEALLAAGVPLDEDQLKALGWSQDQYNEYLRKQELKQAAGGGGVEPETTPTYGTSEWQNWVLQTAEETGMSIEDVLYTLGLTDAKVETWVKKFADYEKQLNPDPVNTVSDLGEAARAIYDDYTSSVQEEYQRTGRISTERWRTILAKKVEAALENGKITEEEANYLLTLAGVPEEV